MEWPTVGATDTAGVPVVVDRATWQAELDTLRIRDKAHTREGDAIAALRWRRLPMAEVDSALTVTGRHGPVTLLEVFEGRRQLIAYYFMWSAGRHRRRPVRGPRAAAGRALRGSSLLQLGALAGLVNDLEQAA